MLRGPPLEVRGVRSACGSTIDGLCGVCGEDGSEGPVSIWVYMNRPSPRGRASRILSNPPRNSSADFPNSPLFALAAYNGLSHFGCHIPPSASVLCGQASKGAFEGACFLGQEGAPQLSGHYTEYFHER